VALIRYQRDLQHRLEVCRGDGNPSSERSSVLEVESARGMIARFDAIEQLAAGSMAARHGSRTARSTSDCAQGEEAIGHKTTRIRPWRTLSNKLRRPPIEPRASGPR
jgi:hypothetical protein